MQPALHKAIRYVLSVISISAGTYRLWQTHACLCVYSVSNELRTSPVALGIHRASRVASSAIRVSSTPTDPSIYAGEVLVVIRNAEIPT